MAEEYKPTKKDAFDWWKFAKDHEKDCEDEYCHLCWTFHRFEKKCKNKTNKTQE